MRFRDAEVGEEERDRLGALRRAAVGVQREHLGCDLLLAGGLVDQRCGEVARSRGIARSSRAWTVQYRENAQLATALIDQAASQQQITPKILTLHADRGAPQRAKPVAFLLADLGITRTHSRPYTSSDNPYSESNFKTLKYRPEFPARFETIEHARTHCRAFVDWYNHAHRHSGIGLMTPSAVHHGHAKRLHTARSLVLNAAYERHPERFVRRPPIPPELPTAAWINKPDTNEVAH